MPKIRSRRWKTAAPAQPAPAPLPLRFVLPQDQELLEACVAIVAIECAFQVVHIQVQIGSHGKEVMAQELALMLEKQEHKGKVGTNDLVLFRRLCIDAFERTYPIARSLLLEGRMQLDPTWTNEQRGLFYGLLLEQALTPAS